MPPEEELIRRCVEGDQDAWGRLFDAHYPPAKRYLARLSPWFTAEDVEELAQETFLSVVHHLREFDRRSHLQTWIFRIASNKAKDFIEKRMAAKRGSGAVPVSLSAPAPGNEDGEPPDPPSPARNPSEDAMRGEDFARVGEALGQIGDPCREIIQLRYFGDQSYEEIATTLSLNPKTVSSRLSKCLDRLEEIVRQLLPDFPV